MTHNDQVSSRFSKSKVLQELLCRARISSGEILPHDKIVRAERERERERERRVPSPERLPRPATAKAAATQRQQRQSQVPTPPNPGQGSAARRGEHDAVRASKQASKQARPTDDARSSSGNNERSQHPTKKRKRSTPKRATLSLAPITRTLRHLTFIQSLASALASSSFPPFIAAGGSQEGLT